MTGKNILKRCCALLLVLGTAALLMAAGTEAPSVKAECTAFTESAKPLKNPNRGFYYIYRFEIKDKETDYSELVPKLFQEDTETTLALVEFNLKEFKDQEISPKGMANLEKLFQALEKTGKRLIVRFLYDWDEKAMDSEPENMGQILFHIRQVGPLLKAHEKQIFTLQGIFLGNCGEMHSSRYMETERVQTLARKLGEAAGENIYLALRTPLQWRQTTRVSNPAGISRRDKILATRIGLFNDGMLGSGSDLGTYGAGSREKDGPLVSWSREEELDFQNVLCRLVPNGGEVVIDNYLNNLENAVKDLSRMHITYLNMGYDKAVLDKWAASKISEPGVFSGMDGLSYMERRLGYRLVLREARMSGAGDTLSLEADLQNVGFAPVYKAVETRAVLRNTQSGKELSYVFPQDVRQLFGGTESAQKLTLSLSIPLAELEGGSWTVYLEMKDQATGQRILFGNEAEPEQAGYRLGSVELTK